MLGGVAGLGAAVGAFLGESRVTELISGSGYLTGISILLAQGLYSSAHGIAHDHLKNDARQVLVAVTVGVLLKAVIITVVMLVIWPGPESLVAGIVVAQIDPLSVAALGKRSRLTLRGRSRLLAWAAFDDPVTTLLTIYAASLAVHFRDLEPSAALNTGSLGEFGLGLLLNLGLAGLGWSIWRVTGLGRRHGDVAFAAACALLAVLMAVSVAWFLMLAIALTGLYLRPKQRPAAFTSTLDNLTFAAFALTVFGVGLVLPLGVEVLAGLGLGVAAFTAQVIAGRIIGRDLIPSDRTRLAIAQQNGITAMVLALLLLPVFPAIVAIVAPGILIINVLNVLTNAVYDATLSLRPREFGVWFVRTVQRRPMVVDAGRSRPPGRAYTSEERTETAEPTDPDPPDSDRVRITGPQLIAGLRAAFSGRHGDHPRQE